MKISKLGHCCLLIEIGTLRILTDPGSYSEGQNLLTNIDLVIISHEHQDHLHIDSIKRILTNNPGTKIITNSGVGKLLAAANIGYTLIDDGKSLEISGITIEGHGKNHEPIYGEFGLVENTGYFIDNNLFYPGDSFHNPNKPVNILALPVVGPWLKLSDSINYALTIKPKFAFPVHDANMLKPGTAHRIPKTVLEQHNIVFHEMNAGDTHEFD